ncbi:MAG: amylo-alpha-1,6-glucosidase [Terriglobia bacterium]
MAIEVRVGPPLITINHGSTFVVSEPDGSITAHTDQGIYSRDTRYVSSYTFFADGQPWTLQNSGATAYFAFRAHLINPRISTEYGTTEPATLGLIFGRAVREGVHEDFDLKNYGMQRVRFNLEIAPRTDFADIFEVKSKRVIRKGKITTQWNPTTAELVSAYQHGDFRRSFLFRIKSNSSPATYANGRINFFVDLAPGASWHTCCEHEFIEPKRRWHSLTLCSHRIEESQNVADLTRWRQRTTSITTANEDVYRLFRRSVEDMAALRLPLPESTEREFVPAAGVPWFVTVFGRDSLIVSLQNMIVFPDFARGALDILGKLQATETDNFRDAQPGKIPHEMRYGELAETKQIPHTPYYGTADATALYLIALHESWKWLGDDSLFIKHQEVAERCLEWIERYGDLDGDGFQEYQTQSPQGYENMGWKDAAEAVVYPDGSRVKGPKALCELQGYTYDAWIRMAEAFSYFGNAQRAAALREKARALRQRFEEHFWCDDIHFYAFALDVDKRPVRTIASNPGHLLWTEIASQDHAGSVIKRLLEPDMWSGWGIRTLSEAHPAYNPFSYQNGSVWPHDNGIIAMGCRRYGYLKEAAMIARDISEAASYFAFYRLPELYAGIRREKGNFPVQYLGANVPQAWAAGSVFHLLRAILGLDAEAHKSTLYVEPALPEWLSDITLHNLRVGTATVTIRFWREGEKSRYEVLSATGSIHVEEGRSALRLA